jgi:hypothetical protein
VFRGNNEQWICPIYTKDGDWNHILRCNGTVIWREIIWTRGSRISMQKYEFGGQEDARIKSNGKE